MSEYSILYVCVAITAMSVIASITYLKGEAYKNAKDPTSICFIEATGNTQFDKCVEFARVLNKESK